MLRINSIWNQDNFSVCKCFGFLLKLCCIRCNCACILQRIQHMRKLGWIKCNALYVIAADGDHAGDVQIFSSVGCDESGFGEKVSVEHIEWNLFVFFEYEFEPINKRIVHAFGCAEARDTDSV